MQMLIEGREYIQQVINKVIDRRIERQGYKENKVVYQQCRGAETGKEKRIEGLDRLEEVEAVEAVEAVEVVVVVVGNRVEFKQQRIEQRQVELQEQEQQSREVVEVEKLVLLIEEQQVRYQQC